METRWGGRAGGGGVDEAALLPYVPAQPAPCAPLNPLDAHICAQCGTVPLIVINLHPGCLASHPRLTPPAYS